LTEVDHLYGLPLEEFTPARDAAAKEIRKAGDRETAAVVAKLPKPTPAAWAANQVARNQPELIEALLDAGSTLREAQEAALEGGGGRGLRDATQAERKAVDAVMGAAAELRPGGRPLSNAMAERLRTTLHAAAADEAIRDALANGRLVSEAQAGGAWPFALEAAPAAAPAKKPEPPAKKKKPAAKKQTKDERAAEREAKAREAAEQAERERAAREARKALEKELRDARSSLRVRERVLAGAEADANDAAAKVGDAQDALEAAQQALEDAKSEAEAAQNVLTEARTALARARDRVAELEERLD
jgi:DNA repair exonuclease SbcCD ATPase subunit